MLQGDQCDRGGGLVVYGGPGSGKTTLMRRFLELAEEAGAPFLSATGFHAERGLPYSILEQFACSPGISPDARRSLVRLIETGAPPVHGGDVPAPLLRDLADALRGLARDTPLVVAVDDAHHADPASWQCLLHLARRARCTGIITVLTCVGTRREGIADGRPELPDTPGRRTVELAALTGSGVRRLVEERLGTVSAGWSAYLHGISGGNRALVQALLCDASGLRGAPAHGADAPEAADGTGKVLAVAYLGLLRRHPPLLECARALAVLGEHATPELAARLSEGGAAATGRQVRTLDRAGLLDGAGFRHPAARSAVLESLDRAERSRLHRRCAELLAEEGAPAEAVAPHLVAADERPTPAQVVLLRTAAERLIRDGRTEEAVRCLRLAERADLDERQRCAVVLERAAAQWHINPAMACPGTDHLLAGMRSGLLDGRELNLLLTWLLLFGREEAHEVAVRIAGTAAATPDGRERIQAARLLFALIHTDPPEELGAPGAPGEALPGIAATMAAWTERVLGLPVDPADLPAGPAGADGAPHRDGPATAPVPLMGPEQERHQECITACLVGTALVDYGAFPLAERLGEELMARYPAASFPASHAAAASLRAGAALARGDLRRAAELADTALELLPDEGWGVFLSAPLGTAVVAHTLLGRPETAARYLERPVPDMLFRTRLGSTYLLARGHHYLATGRPNAALGDFTACETALEPGMDGLYRVARWRTSAAEAYLAMGRRREARKLAEEELARLDGGPARGRALRIMAAVGDPARRERYLEEAVSVLRDCRARLDLAYALVGLGRVRMENGAHQEARPLLQEARWLADVCGASYERLTAGAGWEAQAAVPEPRTADPAALGTGPAAAASHVRPALSEAEWRVAVLAAEGRSNRQIAKRFYITVSTVEQHLTRVYRKLSVEGRSELARLLGPFIRLEERPSG
ncbi:helix-turn-helix transcriptional regulator [Nocardiopsis suaedae]